MNLKVAFLSIAFGVAAVAAEGSKYATAFKKFRSFSDLVKSASGHLLQTAKGYGEIPSVVDQYHQELVQIADPQRRSRQAALLVGYLERALEHKHRSVQGEVTLMRNHVNSQAQMIRSKSKHKGAEVRLQEALTNLDDIYSLFDRTIAYVQNEEKAFLQEFRIYQ